MKPFSKSVEIEFGELKNQGDAVLFLKKGRNIYSESTN